MSALLSGEASQFNWLIDTFVTATAGVSDAVAVSSDGLLIASSASLGRDDADQVSAIVSAFVSLGTSTARCFEFTGLQQVVVSMGGGYLFVSSISDGSALGVVATSGCDIGSVAYQSSLLVERAGALLTPELIAELRREAGT
jgi:predicted regulator of Ras-like GTPase activity (Roadblock/LC7/MglB family)